MQSGFLGTHYQIEYVTPEDAKNEIAECKEQQPP